jgi:two-component system OmpR family response regulator
VANAWAGEKVQQTMTSALRKVLIVDDDATIRAMVTEYLGERGFQVTAVADSRGMSEALGSHSVDLVLLDLKLPDEDGMNLIRVLRVSSGVPIIVLSGHRREEVDRVVGLELGADDYLIKPFSLGELAARIGAVLRRADASVVRAGGGSEPDRPSGYRFAGWQLEMRQRRLLSPAGETVPLTKGEFNLLTAFLRAPRRVLSREQLLTASRVHDDEVFDRSIDVQILRPHAFQVAAEVTVNHEASHH